MKFAVGAVFKNETHIMIEWIEHYLFHGVDHLFLINDHSTDAIDIIKFKYSNDLRVTFYESDVDTGPYRRQNDIYTKYLYDEIKKYDWFALLDLDEFLYSPKYINLKDALSQIPFHISQIHANWVTFGSNNHITQPISVVQGFDKRISDIANVNFLSHKSIFRPAYLQSIDIHSCSMNGISENYSYLKNPEDPLFLLNHYVIQSESYFKAVKAKRGDVNKIVHTEYRNMDYFNTFNHNDVLDDRLYTQNKELISYHIYDTYEFHRNHLKLN